MTAICVCLYALLPFVVSSFQLLHMPPKVVNRLAKTLKGSTHTHMKQIHKSTAKALFKSQLYNKHKRGIRTCDEMSMAEGKQEISGKWEKIDSKTNKKRLQQKHRNIFLVFPLCSLILSVLIQDSLAFCSVSGDLYFVCSWWVEKRNSEWFSCPSECNQSS